MAKRSETTNYSIATIDFLASGGDGYSVMKEGTIIANGGLDVDGFIAYLRHIPSRYMLRPEEESSRKITALMKNRPDFFSVNNKYFSSKKFLDELRQFLR